MPWHACQHRPVRSLQPDAVGERGSGRESCSLLGSGSAGEALVAHAEPGPGRAGVDRVIGLHVSAAGAPQYTSPASFFFGR